VPRPAYRPDREIDPLPYGVVGDPTRLQQALLNFASNAIKFTEAGQITFRVRLEAEMADALLIRFESRTPGSASTRPGPTVQRL
jgi:signal transduction histidine kinase